MSGTICSKMRVKKHEPVIQRILNPFDLAHEGKYEKLIKDNAGEIKTIIIYATNRSICPHGQQGLLILNALRAQRKINIEELTLTDNVATHILAHVG